MRDIWLKYKEHIVIIIFPIFLLLGMFIINFEKIKILSIAPESISEVENNMVISVDGEGFKENDVIYIDGKPQVTTFGNEEWLTCFIPKNLNITKNNIKVQVKRKDSIISQKSNKKALEIAKVSNE